MQVNPKFTGHQNMKECQVGVKRKQQREAADTSALALQQQFSVHGEALDQVEVFKYLRRLLAQGDDHIQAICAQLRKATSQMEVNERALLEGIAVAKRTTEEEEAAAEFAAWHRDNSAGVKEPEAAAEVSAEAVADGAAAGALAGEINN